MEQVRFDEADIEVVELEEIIHGLLHVNRRLAKVKDSRNIIIYQLRNVSSLGEIL